MLALTRKRQQGFVISTSVEPQELARITVVDICGGRVKFEIQTQGDLIVHREEVWERERGEAKAPDAMSIGERVEYQVPYTE